MDLLNASNIVLFAIILGTCIGNKYSENLNKEPERRFRMLKVQNLWDKAQKVGLSLLGVGEMITCHLADDTVFAYP